jgi:hypothetical protein
VISVYVKNVRILLQPRCESVNKSVQKFDFRVAVKAASTIKELRGATRASDVGTNGICMTFLYACSMVDGQIGP